MYVREDEEVPCDDSPGTTLHAGRTGTVYTRGDKVMSHFYLSQKTAEYDRYGRFTVYVSIKDSFRRKSSTPIYGIPLSSFRG